LTTVFFTEKKVESDGFIQDCYEKFCKIKGKPHFVIYIDRTVPKPKLKGDESKHFSLSHSGNITVCAFGDSPVGVDVQVHKDIDFAAVSERFFGNTVTTEREFFDGFTRGEATTKRYEIPLTEGLKIREGKNFHFLKGYSLALCGEEPIFFCEIK